MHDLQALCINVIKKYKGQFEASQAIALLPEHLYHEIMGPSPAVTAGSC